MLLAGVYRPVPLMTTLCMVVSLICSGRKHWHRRTNTQGVCSRHGKPTRHRFIPIHPNREGLKTAGPAFIGAKFAINIGVWPYLLDQTPIKCGSEPAREEGGSFNINVD
jgi:hypothetical protein